MKDDVEDPMDAVFDPPMAPHQRIHLAWRMDLIQQVVARCSVVVRPSAVRCASTSATLARSRHRSLGLRYAMTFGSLMTYAVRVSIRPWPPVVSVVSSIGRKWLSRTFREWTSAGWSEHALT
jgi:hypothetical protein